MDYRAIFFFRLVTVYLQRPIFFIEYDREMFICWKVKPFHRQMSCVTLPVDQVVVCFLSVVQISFHYDRSTSRQMSCRFESSNLNCHKLTSGKMIC